MFCPVHWSRQAGPGFWRPSVRGLNPLAAAISTEDAAQEIVATRPRKGSANSARGAARITADSLATVNRPRSVDASVMVLLRADSTFFGRPTVLDGIKVGAHVFVLCQEVGRISVLGKLGVEGSTKLRWTCSGQFQGRASCDVTVLSSMR